MSYSGKERRRRFVYVTRNTEYHVFDNVCVGVRDRRTGEWVEGHVAMRRRLEGGVRVFSNGAVVPSMRAPELGDPMYFIEIEADESEQVVTSRLEDVARPTFGDLAGYKAG